MDKIKTQTYSLHLCPILSYISYTNGIYSKFWLIYFTNHLLRTYNGLIPSRSPQTKQLQTKIGTRVSNVVKPDQKKNKHST